MKRRSLFFCIIHHVLGTFNRRQGPQPAPNTALPSAKPLLRGAPTAILAVGVFCCGFLPVHLYISINFSVWVRVGGRAVKFQVLLLHFGQVPLRNGGKFIVGIGGGLNVIGAVGVYHFLAGVGGSVKRNGRNF